VRVTFLVALPPYRAPFFADVGDFTRWRRVSCLRACIPTARSRLAISRCRPFGPFGRRSIATSRGLRISPLQACGSAPIGRGGLDDAAGEVQARGRGGVLIGDSNVMFETVAGADRSE